MFWKQAGRKWNSQGVLVFFKFDESHYDLQSIHSSVLKNTVLVHSSLKILSCKKLKSCPKMIGYFWKEESVSVATSMIPLLYIFYHKRLGCWEERVLVSHLSY